MHLPPGLGCILDRGVVAHSSKLLEDWVAPKSAASMSPGRECLGPPCAVKEGAVSM